MWKVFGRHIVWTPSHPPTFFKGGGEVNFNYLPRRRESGNLEKGGGSMVQGQAFLKGGLALFLFNFFKIYHFYILKLLDKVIISCKTQLTSAAISRHQQSTSSVSCSWWWFCYMLNSTCGQVLVLPSRRLMQPAANDDDFVKLLYSLQDCVMHLKKNYFLLPP